MNVDVALTYTQIKQNDMHKKTAIVIDTLRATSTILTALNQNCRRVIPVETVGQALQHKGKPHTVLIGERYNKKLNQFDYGNSPTQISKLDLTGKTVVLTSTNGTKAIHKAKRALHVLIGSLLNSRFCAWQALQYKRDLFIVCAGRRGQFALEDGLTAGLIIQYLKEANPDINCSDTALLLEQNRSKNKQQWSQLIEYGATGRGLIKTGQTADIDYCGHINRFHFGGIHHQEGVVFLPGYRSSEKD